MNDDCRHLLIAEDDPAHVEAIRRSFDASGLPVEIKAVSTLQEFRAHVAQRQPDLAIVDLNLPDGRAVEVLTSPPENGAFPVLVMTAYGNQEVVVEVMKAGALDYMVKSPEAFATLPHTAARTCREWHLLRKQKQAQETIRHSEAQFRAMFEQATVGFCFVSLDGRFLQVNAALCRMLGYTAAELTVRTCVECTFSGDRAFEAERVERLMAGEPVGPWEKRYLRKDGTQLWAHLTLSLLRSPDGQPPEILGVIEDITERKQAQDQTQRQLEELQRWHHVMLGREERNLQLKREINELLQQAGKPLRYPSQAGGEPVPGKAK